MFSSDNVVINSSFNSFLNQSDIGTSKPDLGDLKKFFGRR
jgi:hypothetical protein